MIQYATENAWLIPVLPTSAFVLIGLLFFRSKTLSAAISITAIGAALLQSLLILFAVLIKPEVQEFTVTWFKISGFHVEMGFLIDPIAAMMLVVVTLVALMVQVYSLGYMHGDPGFSSYYAYHSLFAASMLGLVLANNFVQLYIFWELVGLCSYLLIGFWFQKPTAVDAAKKAFITNRIGDFGLLLGILLIQIIFGTLNFQKLQGIIGSEYIAATSLTLLVLLVFAGPVGKSAQFPLHVWLPDAMEGPTPVSALIHAATMVAAGVYLVARAFFLFAASPQALLIVAYLGGFTALFAASIAIVQNDIKRILAFSTLSQLGYMMMALGIGSVTAGMFHLMTHAFFKALLFLGAGSVIHALHEEQDIWKMGKLSKSMPITTATFLIGSLALSGIFPLAGFWSKDEILNATISNGYTGLFILGVFVAFLTSFYMFRLIFVAFYGPSQQHHHTPHESPLVMTIPLIILAALSVAAGWVGIPWLSVNFATYVHYGAVHHGVNTWVMLLSTIVALAGIWTAHMIYRKNVVAPAELVQRYSTIHRILTNKYYIDEIYNWAAARILDASARVLYWVDIKIVDGIVNGLGAGARWSGFFLRLIETGQTQHYAMAMIVGVVLIALMFSLLDAGLSLNSWLGGGSLTWFYR